MLRACGTRVLARLLCLACLLSAAQGAGGGALNGSALEDWNRVLDVSLRTWDEAWLGRAQSVTHYEQLRPLFERLHAGQPLTVVALGSSIVSGYAGCFNDEAQLQQHVRQVRRRGNPQLCPPARGFLGSFMTELNASFPHPEHLFVNLGQPACDLLNYARRWCFTGTLPREVDLFVVEQHGGGDDLGGDLRGRLIEELWVQVVQRGRGTRPPAFLFLDAQFAVEPWHSKDPGRMEACLKSECADASRCADFRTSFFQNNTVATLGNSAEDSHSAVMHVYGFSELSLRNAVVSAIRDGAWNMSECSLAHALYADGIHPSNRGALLIADLLIKHFKDGQAFYRATSVSHFPELHTIRMPHQPVNAGAWRVPLRRCFDVETSVAMPVVAERTTGWAWVEEVGAQWIKPGWISRTTADVLTVRLSSVLRPEHLGENVTLTATFLRSYEHMGNATLCCVAQCVCQQVQMVGLDTSGHVSLETYASVEVTQADGCTLQVTSELDAPDSKFKLLGLGLETYLDPLTDV